MCWRKSSTSSCIKKTNHRGTEAQRGRSLHTLFLPLCLRGSKKFSELFSRDPTVCFQVFCGCLLHDIRRQRWGGRRFIPIERLQVIANVLLVETGLAFPGLIFVRGP